MVFTNQFTKLILFQRAALERDSDGEEQEDEMPTIVTLRKGDLTSDEVERLKKVNPDALKNVEDKEEEKEEGEHMLNKLQIV